MEPHPIRMVVEDDLERSRLTVFFRLLLAIPHIIWLILWGIAVFFVGILSWFIVLFTARLPQSLHDFSSAYVRYGTHVYGYVLLAASPFPGFTGTEAIPSTSRSILRRASRAGRPPSGSSWRSRRFS